MFSPRTEGVSMVVPSTSVSTTLMPGPPLRAQILVSAGGAGVRVLIWETFSSSWNFAAAEGWRAGFGGQRRRLPHHGAAGGGGLFRDRHAAGVPLWIGGEGGAALRR